jgi:hypothetical protein
MPFKIPSVGVGDTDVDNDTVVEDGVLIPWSSDPQSSWMYFDCTVGIMLDSGIVVHNRLPQINRTPDTLASITLDASNLETVTDLGVNLKCNDQYQDIMQRMGHARYWFRIWGQALRVGYQVPIPGIKTIGGVAAIPYDKNPQWAYNRIAPGGNFSGVPLWHAVWSLWYTTIVPTVSNTYPIADPSAHMTGSVTLPQGMQAPFTNADDNAVRVAPPVGRVQ